MLRNWWNGMERTNSFQSTLKTTFSISLESRSEIHRDQQCEQCAAVGKRVWQNRALVSPTKLMNRDVAPIGDDNETIGESRADVEVGNDEDEKKSQESE